jgi:hypothetical protein
MSVFELCFPTPGSRVKNTWTIKVNKVVFHYTPISALTSIAKKYNVTLLRLLKKILNYTSTLQAPTCFGFSQTILNEHPEILKPTG